MFILTSVIYLLAVTTTAAQLSIHFVNADQTSDYKMFSTLTIPVYPVFSTRTNTFQFFHQKLKIESSYHEQCIDPEFLVAFKDNAFSHVFAVLSNNPTQLSVLRYELPFSNQKGNIHSYKSVNNTVYLDISFYQIAGTQVVDFIIVLSLQQRCPAKVTLKTLLNHVTYRDTPFISSYLHDEIVGSNDLHLTSDSYTSLPNQEVVEGKDHSIQFNEIELNNNASAVNIYKILVILACLLVPIALLSPLLILKIWRKRSQSHEELEILDVRTHHSDVMINRYVQFDDDDANSNIHQIA